MNHKHKLHFMHIHCEIMCSECELNLCVSIYWLLRILKNCLFASHVKLLSNYSKFISNISPSMWLSCKPANCLIYLLLLKVYVHYQSGKKTALITSEVHRSICRTIVGGNNVERTIVNNLCSSHPEEVTNGAAKMIKKEALALCKRGSGSILQSKDFKDFFEFKWQQMKDELQRRCPTILSLLSAVVSDQELSCYGICCHCIAWKKPGNVPFPVHDYRCLNSWWMYSKGMIRGGGLYNRGPMV